LFEHLVSAIGESKGLNWVNLSKNKLGYKSMKALGTALAHNKTIKELIFTLNWFKDEVYYLLFSYFILFILFYLFIFFFC